ncbi:hypothetical protein [Novosphingobium sp. 9U]|uniref:hypothetical protein n=1 Tax=Novosphingobium sp. 9U TaxID=2653158 RepID=UPI0012F02278|nr:hypothetical protein [Novosphingobium sp. 9U]VWX53617.1 conserved exported hypothetical protein [Novosphingobium sp. 9U]
MKAILAIALCLLSFPAMAQTNVGGEGMNSPNYSTYQTSVFGWSGGFAEIPMDTPSMRADKLRRAVALRQEADVLLEQDGGTFTPAHEAYVRRKVCAILGTSRTNIGNLAPTDRCRR